MSHSRRSFEGAYLLGQAEWDTGVTPPEVAAQIKGKLSPGRALDLGCGTGTNCIYLARHGWEVVGVDFSYLAIWQARWKAWRTSQRIAFHRADVTDLSFLDGPFDLVLDVGCLHSVLAEARQKYAAGVIRLLRPGGLYMLYAFLPLPGQRAPGVTAGEVQDLFGDAFSLERQESGDDPTGPSSTWYWLRRHET